MTQVLMSMKETAEQIRQAVRTLRRLPDKKVQGYVSTWPDVLYDPLEVLQQEPRKVYIIPTAKEITQMEDVIFNWFKPLEAEETRLVWARAEGKRWKVLEVMFGYERTTLWRRYNEALARIAVYVSNNDRTST